MGANFEEICLLDMCRVLRSEAPWQATWVARRSNKDRAPIRTDLLSICMVESIEDDSDEEVEEDKGDDQRERHEVGVNNELSAAIQRLTACSTASSGHTRTRKRDGTFIGSSVRLEPEAVRTDIVIETAGILLILRIRLAVIGSCVCDIVHVAVPILSGGEAKEGEDDEPEVPEARVLLINAVVCNLCEELHPDDRVDEEQQAEKNEDVAKPRKRGDQRIKHLSGASNQIS